jgi:hypothetical protein
MVREVGAENIVWQNGDVSHTYTNGEVATASRKGVEKAMTDFFVMGAGKVAFLTSGSLFGDTATTRSVVPRRYTINSSGCGPDPSKQRFCSRSAYRPNAR